MAEQSISLEYTPAWIVAIVCFFIVLICFCAERGLHHLGTCLKSKNQKLYQALQRLKEELMLLGFISLLLAVLQGSISHICIPPHLALYMLPCARTNAQQHLATDDSPSEHCAHKGKVPLLSTAAAHELHIFVFVLGLVHVVFCAIIMALGGAKMRQWKYWEDSIRDEISKAGELQLPEAHQHPHHHHHRRHRQVFVLRAGRHWRKAAVVGWLIAFFKQFYGSVTESDYVTLRYGFVQAHCPHLPTFDFHKYMLRTLEIDFRKVVGISAYLWIFLVVSLLLNINGWHTYFWLAFFPLFFLLLVGAKLEHIITRLAKEVVETTTGLVRPSDEHFWFGRPRIVLYIIHFILFQNSFEMAFFFWIWSTYGFNSCIMDKVDYKIPRLISGVIVQVLCSYSTLPLYALVTQMGNMYGEGILDESIISTMKDWAEEVRRRKKSKWSWKKALRLPQKLSWTRRRKNKSSNTSASETHKMDKGAVEIVNITEETVVANEGNMTSIIDISRLDQSQVGPP